MHFWNSSSSKPNRRGRRADGQPGLTFLESDRIPIHESYWRRHRGELIVCAMGGLGCLATMLTLSWMFWSSPDATGFIMGPALPLFFGVAAMGLLGSILLPVLWYRGDRRMEKILEEDEAQNDENQDKNAESPDVVLSGLQDSAELSEEAEQISADSAVEKERKW